MARMHSRAKGKSSSKKPSKKTKPVWMKRDTKEVEQLVVKLANKGETSSKIGIELRDSYGVPDVGLITGKKITKILEEHKLLKKLPEDMIALIKREILIAKHLENNKHDETAKRGLQLTISKIRRLMKYYKKVGKIPQDWKYDREQAKLIVG
ncbi:MAG: 30S ribosomal protein S15 [Candidatus Nanoarchaeia archaeon]|nr:30S ribosomal protein S15 [Candidatus Nanoarchaeia archaeon]